VAGGALNRPGHELFGHDVYALAGHGCMMEGVAAEAASLAGHLALANLCWVYDNNHVTIEGDTSLAFTEDVGARFAAYGWRVERVADANDLDAISTAFDAFARETRRPTLIVVDSHIGYGAPAKQDTSAAHGEPLGAGEARAAKRAYGWPEDARFLVPDEVREHFAAGVSARGAELRRARARGLRAADPRCAGRRPHAVHARRWDRAAVGALGAGARRAAARAPLRARLLGPGGGRRADRAAVVEPAGLGLIGVGGQHARELAA
jgi:transketolase